MDLLHFRLEFAEALCASLKKKPVDPCDFLSDEETETSVQQRCSPIPGNSKKIDELNHWPVVKNLSTAGMCRRVKECRSSTRTRFEKTKDF